MARSSRKTTFDLDLKMFALAKDKELLNSAALMICQKCIEFTAENSNRKPILLTCKVP